MNLQVQEQSASPRERIISTAMRLFFEQGYIATGINQIIKEAGVCKASFYGNFPSKEDLCLTYIEESHQRWMELLTEFIAKYEGPYERLLAVFEFLKTWMNRCTYRGCALMNIATEIPDVQSRLRDKVQARNQVLKDAVTLLVDDLVSSDNHFRNVSVSETVEFLLLIVQGAIINSRQSADAGPIESAKRSFIKLLNAQSV